MNASPLSSGRAGRILFDAALDAVAAGALIIAGLCLVYAGILPGLSGGEISVLSDPDAYARLLRVIQLWETGDWFDRRLYAIYPPQGLSMHWTRPLDILTLAGAAPIAWLSGAPFREAVFQVALYGPMAGVAVIAIILRRVAAPVTGAAGSLLVVPAYLGSWPLLSGLRIGLLDHHFLMLALFLGVFALVLGHFGNPDRSRLPVVAGVLASLSIWVSTEGFLALICGLGMLGCGWILGRLGPRSMLRFCAGALAGTAVALVIERATDLWGFELDSISLVHLTMAAAAALGAAVLCLVQQRGLLATWAWRVGAAALITVVLSAALVGLFPELLSGPFAAAGPLARSIVLPVNYAYGLATRFDRIQFVAGPAAALPALGYLLAAARAPDRFVASVTQALLLVGLFLACFASGRIAHYLMLAAIPSWAMLMHLAGRRLFDLGRPVANPLALPAVLVLAFWPYGGAILMYGPERFSWRLPGEGRTCRYDQLAPLLDRLRPDRNGVVATNVFEGPQVAFETGRPVIAGPYIRSEQSLKDYHDFFSGPPEAARRVAWTRGVETVVLCRRKIFSMVRTKAAPGSIMHGLMRRRFSSLLQPVRLPSHLAAGYRVFLVDPLRP